MSIGASRDFVALGKGYARLASWSSHFFTSYWVDDPLVRSPHMIFLGYMELGCTLDISFFVLPKIMIV